MRSDKVTKDKVQRNFDFGTIGKRTPFRTPEGFFEQQEQELKDKVTMYNVQRKPLRRKWWYAAAASALLLIAVYPVIQLIHSSSDQPVTSVSDSAPVYSQTSSASDDWSDFADADLFMDNMNW